MKYFLLFALLVSNHLIAQRFNAGAVVGVNFAQIDGDDQFGFHKKGITAGAKAIAYLSPLMELNVDLLYSQRGAQPPKRKPRYVKMNLDFVETLFLLNFKVPKAVERAEADKRRKKRDLKVFIPFQFHTGISYGRLIQSEVVAIRRPSYLPYVEPEVSFEEIRTSFNKNDVSVVTGFSYFFSPHIGSTFRFYIPTNKLYDSASFPDKVSRSMQSFFLTAQVVYLL